MNFFLHHPQLILSVAASFVSIMLTARKVKETRDIGIPAGSFRLRWDFVAGLIMWTISTWFALVHDYFIHMAGIIFGALGCCYMLYGAFRMTRNTATAVPLTNKQIRMSELKKASKKR